jgi:parvulin-like peptidyl-prolyl isomerase
MAGMTDDLVKRLRDFEQWMRNPEDQKFTLSSDLFDEVANRIDELEAALRLGVDMREKQKAYFKRRFQDVLLDCKKAERDFDVAARATLGEKKDGSV